MSHRSEKSTKLFVIPGKVPGTFPGNRGAWEPFPRMLVSCKSAGIFPGNLPCFLSVMFPSGRGGIASGNFPGKMSFFLSATVVIPISEATCLQRLNGGGSPMGFESSRLQWR